MGWGYSKFLGMKFFLDFQQYEEKLHYQKEIFSLYCGTCSQELRNECLHRKNPVEKLLPNLSHLTQSIYPVRVTRRRSERRKGGGR